VIELQYKDGLPDFRLMVIDQTIKPTTYALIYWLHGRNSLGNCARSPHPTRESYAQVLGYFGISIVYLARDECRGKDSAAIIQGWVYRDIKITLMAMNPDGDFSALVDGIETLRNSLRLESEVSAGHLLNGLVETFLLNQPTSQQISINAIWAAQKRNQ